MKEYWFTMKWFKVYYAISIVGMATLALLTRDWLLAFTTWIPVYLIERLVLDRYRPPRLGEKRFEEVHYYRDLIWDGKQWVEAKET